MRQAAPALQACVTGQTAHLHAEEVGEIVVPARVLDADTSAARPSKLATPTEVRGRVGASDARSKERPSRVSAGSTAQTAQPKMPD
jgi:hypothetical protein